MTCPLEARELRKSYRRNAGWRSAMKNYAAHAGKCR